MKYVQALLMLFAAAPAMAIDFDAACEPARKQIIIGAVGDFLMHKPLQLRGYQVGFEKLWAGVQSRIDEVDVMYANLETPTANGVTKQRRTNGIQSATFDDNTFSSYPIFNVHDSMLDDIKASGFDVLSTANNHSMDRGQTGVDKTIDALESRGMLYTGTRKRGNRSSFVTYLDTAQIRLAFVACTFSLNGFSDPENQVLDCYTEKSQLKQEIQQALQNSDAVIVTPHWGVEYQHTPAAREKALARELLDAGALAVIGTHPHVIQPMEKYVTRDGRETAIVYSTGNFISSQPRIRKVGLMAFLGLSTDGAKVWINGLRYSPTYFAGTVQGLSFLEGHSMESTFMPTVKSVMKDPQGMLSPREKLSTNPQCR